MNLKQTTCLMAVTALAIASCVQNSDGRAPDARVAEVRAPDVQMPDGKSDSAKPIVSSDVVFDEVDGVVAVEAEHFYKQTLTDKRAWHISSSAYVPNLKPDVDPGHVAGASGGAYLEILPDTRATHAHEMVHDENFTDKPGVLAVVHYQVNIKTPGRYYVWVRSFSTGSEDNGVHVGLNGQWPASGQRWQTINKKAWAWDCKQRTEAVHVGVPMQLFLDIEKAGKHEIMFSLREDGFEMDKFILASNKEFKPEDKGPAVRLASGTLPAAFAEVAVAAPEMPRYPAHWGTPPALQTKDIRPLPGGFGEGSSTLAEWIQGNLDHDAAASARALMMDAASFSLEGTGYYLDRGKWLAINPEKNKTAQAKQAFPFPSGRYDVTLEAVGEEDGKSTFAVANNDQEIGTFVCPLAHVPMEEGARYNITWKNQEISSGDIIAVSSTIASADGVEYSRARWARVSFVPADDATKAAAAPLIAAERAKGVAATKTTEKTSEVATKAAEVIAKVEKTPAAALPPLVLPRKSDGKGTVAISGELKQWHKITLALDGPYAHELDNQPNPFLDYRFNVTFTHESGSPRYTVPGYFAADGNAGETAAESGTTWRAHLSPDKTGRWNWQVSFLTGPHVAIGPVGENSAKPLAPFDGMSGHFSVAASDKTGRDFRAHGRLHYVGKHHLQFAGSKQYFLKVGPDSPETLLAYVDFDNTQAMKKNVPLKTWEAHVQDWRAGDPTWKNGKGKGLIGALNYLADKGLNSISFLPYNAGGDGDNVWPFISRNDKLHYDCSKLDQWSVVFSHATAKGLYLHFKLQETEIDDNRRGMKAATGVDVPESLDGGLLGTQRKLYCREIIARFAHELALNWNIGEENTQSTEEINDMINYVRANDPYQHLVVIHTFPGQQDKVYEPLLGKKSQLSGASLQNDWAHTHQRSLDWITKSAASGTPWVVANDEQGGADTGVPPDMGYAGYNGTKKDGKKVHTSDNIRHATLWGNFMAGGAGVEYYFGYQLAQNDLVCEDFRSRDKSWDYARIAVNFFHDHQIPFWTMKNANALIGNEKNDNSKYCLAQAGECYLVYLPTGGTTDINLSGVTGNFTVQWFNPRSGGKLSEGSVKSVTAGNSVSVGLPPADTELDWLAVIRR
jgi:Domain of unknown function (DUF5060)/Putative collagen-binding domain of a collagenase